MSKILTVYFSRRGQNYCNGEIRYLNTGNTAVIAAMIREICSCDLFEVESLKPYPEDYHECTEVAKRELKAKAGVEIKEFLPSLEDYGIIFVGYPNWWGTMPRALVTFLEHYDLNGRTIIPFCTHEGSGMGHSERELKEICRGAVLKPGLPIRGSEAARSRTAVVAWVKASL